MLPNNRLQRPVRCAVRRWTEAPGSQLHPWALFAGVGNTGSRHARDWTQIAGLFSLAFALLLNEAHRVVNPEVKRTAARAAIALTLPCAVLMTYWQLLADRQWIRLDILNVLVLCAIGAVMLGPSEWFFRRASARRDTPVSGSAA